MVDLQEQAMLLQDNNTISWLQSITDMGSPRIKEKAEWVLAKIRQL
jgi:hypothetical protein